MKTFNLIIIMHYFVGFMFLPVAMSFSNTFLFFSLLLRRRWYVALWNYEERRAVYFIKNSKDTFKSLWMNGNNSLLKVFSQLLGLHGFFGFSKFIPEISLSHLRKWSTFFNRVAFTKLTYFPQNTVILRMSTSLFVNSYLRIK